jgi:predicted 2-oxoglutarate/Fe(II)-dependent dioxygenase YbiX
MSSVSSEARAVLDSLLDILDTVERPGDYVAWGSLESVTPRIDIEGLGPLSFPLPESQARQLIALAERAPYGRGGETRVDTDVRKAWQLPAGKVIEGERWHKTMEAITQAARAGLGVDDTVRAELYKLLVYDEGSFFLPHRDTEKVEGMFATLVVVLPSVHEGGQLVVRHKQQSTTLSLGQGDLALVSWAAFYTDCLHELLPVTAGYRVALVYNLVRPAGPLHAPDHSEQAERVARLLDGWRERPEGWPAKVALALEHHYTPAGLSFAGLKGADAGTASVLLEAGQRADFAVHLAMISIHESGAALENSYGSRRHRGPSTMTTTSR